MKQSTLIKYGYILMAVLAVAAILAVTFMVRATNSATDAQDTRLASINAAEQLRGGSGHLTDTVRGYVVTGDRNWLNQYWTEINETKSRDRAIQTLTEMGTPAEELALIEQAGKNSTGLVAAETRAQRLTLEATGVAQADMPPAVAEYQLIPADRALEPAEQRALATTLVYGRDYLAAVDEIMAPINQFNESMTARVQADVDSAQDAQLLSEIALSIVVAMLLAALGAFLFIMNTKVGRVLTNYARTLTERDPYDLTVSLEPDGVQETQVVAEAFNAQQVSLADVLRSIEGNTVDLEQAATRLAANSDQFASSAAQTSQSASNASNAATEVSGNVDSVAAGTEEMNASIREIASAAARASEVAMEAVRSAEATSATVAELSESSIRIGEVMKSITSIAEQTNLLALNATIEAARAGEAGKGFAVVANEVKDLAQQSAGATEDISEKVLSIQGDAAATSQALAEITEVIARINETQSTIASAVEEQTATTNEMSRSVQDAASGARGIAETIRGVANLAGQGSEAAGVTRTEVTTLTDLANQMSASVRRFKINA
ncbi:MAG: methyl-accepting chemotaxis protein [Dermatophilus congolensis]|nr:methyl-accepting chemotaxis protein [Dermatophilus congolensis]